MSQGTSTEDHEDEAARRLAGTLGPSMIDTLLADATTTGTPIDGVDGLLNQMTKAVLERALQAEMTHELGYTRDDPAGARSGNSRNDSGRKTISTANGPVTIDVPHNRNGTFEPKIVPKRARRLGQIDDWTTSSADLDEGSPGGRDVVGGLAHAGDCLLYTSPSPRDLSTSRMPSSA